MGALGLGVGGVGATIGALGPAPNVHISRSRMSAAQGASLEPDCSEQGGEEARSVLECPLCCAAPEVDHGEESALLPCSLACDLDASSGHTKAYWFPRLVAVAVPLLLRARA